MGQQLPWRIQVELPTSWYIPAPHLFRDEWSGSEHQQRDSDLRQGLGLDVTKKEG